MQMEELQIATQFTIQVHFKNHHGTTKFVEKSGMSTSRRETTNLAHIQVDDYSKQTAITLVASILLEID